MRTKTRECVYALLNRHSLLEAAIGAANDPQRSLYANRLILDSNRLSFEPRQREEYVSLRSIAERQFAVNHHWVHALNDHLRGLEGPAADWENIRAKELGRCFTSHFPDLEEGLPLHIQEAGKFRPATSADEAFRC